MNTKILSMDNSVKTDINNIKKLILKTAYENQTGHIPSALSCVEILYALYKTAKIEKPFTRYDRDRIIISKEHGRLAQVCVMAYLDFIPKDLLNNYMGNNSPLGHDLYGVVKSRQQIDAIDVSSGSLGHGLAVGLGLACANPNNIYVICGDGELQEGSCWEAINFAGHHKMRNYTLIVDRNFNQIDGETANIIDSSSNLKEKFIPFGFDVLECNGHSVDELEKVLTIKTDKPKCVIANTIKGKEILFVKDRIGAANFHWGNLSKEDYLRAMEELDNEHV